MTLVQHVRIGRGGFPSPPVEVADAVEEYARQWGRHATLAFRPTMFANQRILRGTWVVCLTLRADDKRLKLSQEGRVASPPTEDVWLHEPNPKVGKLIPGTYGLKEPPMRALAIEQLGATGVVRFLERGNMWSGRTGTHSPEQAMRQGDADEHAKVEKARAAAREAGAKIASDQRRSRFKIPFVRVGIDLLKKGTPRAAAKPRKER